MVGSPYRALNIKTNRNKLNTHIRNDTMYLFEILHRCSCNLIQVKVSHLSYIDREQFLDTSAFRGKVHMLLISQSSPSTKRKGEFNDLAKCSLSLIYPVVLGRVKNLCRRHILRQRGYFTILKYSLIVRAFSLFLK